MKRSAGLLAVVNLQSTVMMKDSLISQEEINKLMVDYLLTLTKREQTVLTMRYNNEGQLQQTLQQVARVIGVTRERIRQIVKRCIRKMRYRRKIDSLKIR